MNFSSQFLGIFYFLLAQCINQECCAAWITELKVHPSLCPLSSGCSRGPTGLWAEGPTEEAALVVRSGHGRTGTPAAAPLLRLPLLPSMCSHHTCGLPLQHSHLCCPKGCEKSLGHWESSLSLNTKTAPVQAVSQTSDPSAVFLVLFCFSKTSFNSDLFDHIANVD